MRRADVGFSHGTWCGTDECRHGSTVRYWRNCAACQPLSAGPLCGRIRPGDELRYRLAGCAPGSLIQGIEIFPDGSARLGDGLPVYIIRPGSRALLVGIGSNQAGIDSKGRPINHPFCHAASNHGLEQLAQQIAIAEAAMPILGEGRVVRHLTIEAEPAEPAVGEASPTAGSA